MVPTPEDMLRVQHPLPARPTVRGPGGDALATNGLPPRPRIGLGGAVFRRGHQQINYQPDLPPRRRPPPGALVDYPDDDIPARAPRRPLSPDQYLPPPEMFGQPQQQTRPRRRAAREAMGNYDPAAHAAIDAEIINERIRHQIENRDNGGIPGIVDRHGDRGYIFDAIRNVLGQGEWAAEGQLYDRLRAVRQNLVAEGGHIPMLRAQA